MIIETVGVLGASLLLYAFFKVSRGQWRGRSLNYELFNLVGAALLLIYAFYKDAYANMILNIVWVGVALFGINNLIEIQKSTKANKKKRKKTRT